MTSLPRHTVRTERVVPDLRALAGRLPRRPVTRFAPSPTGILHLGHVVNAIYVWGVARALGGRVVLRLEDHDRARCRPSFEDAILEDLDWLGFEPDIGATAEFRAGPTALRQSDAEPAYREALGRLRLATEVYACKCSRKDIAGAMRTVSEHERRYPGSCRPLGLEERPGLGLRVRLDPGIETFDDVLLGRQSQDPSQQCGDLLVRDRQGFWTYQFSVVVDDCRQGVDLVIRGRDLVASTGRQLRLARLLGRRHAPVFLHHGLLVKPSGEKLSKSTGDTGIRHLRAAGHSPSEVLGLAAHLCGLSRVVKPLAATQLPRLFGA